MRTRLAGLLTALVLGGATLTGCTSGHDATVNGGTFAFQSDGSATEFSYPAADRQTIGDIGGPTVSGDGTVALSQYRGKVVVLSVWGSWCGPCRQEAAGLQAASEELGSEKVQFIGINVKDLADDAKAFEASMKLTYPSIFDPKMRSLLSIRNYPIKAIPSNIVIDQQGRVAQIWLHEVTQTELVATVNAIVPGA